MRTTKGSRSALAGVAALLLGLALGSTGCASAVATPFMPRIYSGTQVDAAIVAGKDTPLSLRTLAFVDFLPSVALDTVALPYTTYCTLDGKHEHGLLHYRSK